MVTIEELAAFFDGIKEFRSDYRLYDSRYLDRAYNAGRSLAHALTLNYWYH